MRSVKILHSSDFRLDMPFEGLNTARAVARRGEQRLLLSALAELASGEAADLVLLSGNLLDSENTFYETAEDLFHHLGQIPCPVFISPGSQDYYSPRSPYAHVKIPDNVHVFHENELRFVSVPSANARVFGAAFTERHCRALLHGFHAQRRDGIYNLLCLHGTVGNASSHENPISTEDLAASGLDYAALGFTPSASGLLQSGSTWYSWPGCPEGRGFDETGEKGVLLAELSPVIAAFFDGVMVMDKDEAVRNNRLALLGKCNELLMTAGDLSVMA